MMTIPDFTALIIAYIVLAVEFTPVQSIILEAGGSEFTNDLSTRLGLAALFVSLFSNVLATVLVGWKAWYDFKNA